ncbi:MAG: XdhC family protein [Acidimicrobiaceae bacterium]|nr:XdhC family protein [Acidimicrobiaceae bacterium]
MLEELGAQVQDWLDGGRPVALARVVELRGFSAWAGDPLVAVEGAGGQVGDILGRFGTAALAPTVERLAPERFEVVEVDVQGEMIREAGLVCGGQVSFLVQPAAEIPPTLWTALAERSPVALVTRVEGPTAGPASMVVLADGTWSGALAVGEPDHLAGKAVELIAEGGHGTRRIEDGAGVVLIESWVPEPRLVVVGDGDLVDAIKAQAGLLGWEARSGPSVADAEAALAWAADSAAVVMLSHDPDVDTPVLSRALERRVAYVGAMGSRRTQTARLERLRAVGFGDADLERIHRPIGLDLGGRRPAEVAMAIVAEILAVRSGRDGRPLGQRQGPIHAPLSAVAGA